MPKSDFLFQFQYVLNQIPRVLSMQDNNPVSPSRGCFHYPYWRDKTSEFADARFQEVGATLAMLLTSELKNSVSLPGSILRDRFSSSLRFWDSIQHRDGSFDEWYKFEHGFAATEFTSIAYGAAANLDGKNWSKDDWERFRRVGEKAGNWLLRHDDLVKANHEMAGAAALALLGKALDKPEFLAGARKKYDLAFTLRHDEGWFTEIAGMDLGYCSVLLDYAMLYHYVTGDERVPIEMARLFRFMFPFIHPDLTISPEAGLCLNPYVSRLGVLLLAKHCPEAAWFVSRLSETEVGFDGISPYLSDDLRLCRWSYLPALTLALGIREGLLTESGELKAALEETPPPLGLHFAEEAQVIAFRSEKVHAVFLPAGGGQVRAYLRGPGGWKSREDLGVNHELADGTKLTGVGYDNERTLRRLSELKFELEVPMNPARFFFPGFLPRMVLRMLGAIPGLAVWLRRGIDWYRKRNRTAVNQSAAPVSGATAPLTLIRTVEFMPNGVAIHDTFRGQLQLEPRINVVANEG